MINREKEREILSNPIRDLQFMLGRLADRYDFLPALSLDGLFGEETLEAVLLFQAGDLDHRLPGALCLHGHCLVSSPVTRCP